MAVEDELHVSGDPESSKRRYAGSLLSTAFACFAFFYLYSNLGLALPKVWGFPLWPSYYLRGGCSPLPAQFW